jgi:hypothetical protein
VTGKNYSAIVASLHARTGKTLLARVLTDYFLLSDQSPIVFDTDVDELPLSACFPGRSLIVDLNEVRGQMTLFDGLAEASDDSRVVDVIHQSFRKFFALMRDTDFIAEARHHGVEPVIFYIADRNRDSLEEGLRLIERFPDCAVVIVDNVFLRQAASATRYSILYQALEAHDLHLHMPALDHVSAAFVEDSTMSLGDFLRAPLPLSCASADTNDVALNARAAIRAWVVKMFREIHRVTQAVERRVPVEAQPLLLMGASGPGR